MHRIFIVEDEKNLREELKLALERKGYECIVTENFEIVSEQIKEAAPDLVLLDLNVPYQDGFYICQEIRKTMNIPIIILTSSSDELDELMSLKMGADDYITKPYNIHLLDAHIQAVLKRVLDPKKTRQLMYKGLILEPLKSKMIYKNQSIELTKNELRILTLLMENAGFIVSRSEMIRYLWSVEEFVEESTLNVNINRLRKKLAEIGLPDFLITKRGMGYKI